MLLEGGARGESATHFGGSETCFSTFARSPSRLLILVTHPDILCTSCGYVPESTVQRCGGGGGGMPQWSTIWSLTWQHDPDRPTHATRPVEGRHRAMLPWYSIGPAHPMSLGLWGDKQEVNTMSSTGRLSQPAHVAGCSVLAGRGLTISHPPRSGWGRRSSQSRPRSRHACATTGMWSAVGAKGTIAHEGSCNTPPWQMLSVRRVGSCPSLVDGAGDGDGDGDGAGDGDEQVGGSQTIWEVGHSVVDSSRLDGPASCGHALAPWDGSHLAARVAAGGETRGAGLGGR